MRGDGEQSSKQGFSIPEDRGGANDGGGTSPKQIAANRRNAMRSTGPRTAEGRLASKFNATKHGLRASEIVIPGESRARFDRLRQELFDDLMPQGRTEIGLVTEIAIDHWKLRRAHRAEHAEIVMQMMRQTPRDPAEDVAHRIPRSSFRMEKMGRLQQAVKQAMGELEREGTVSQETCEKLNQMFRYETDNVGQKLKGLRLEEVCLWQPKSPEDMCPPKEMRPENKAAAREYLENCWDELERLGKKILKREKRAHEIELQRLSIPQAQILERIQRYQTSIKRDMYRAMDQLERLQRRRRGEPPPPTVNLNISSDDDH